MPAAQNSPLRQFESSARPTVDQIVGEDLARDLRAFGRLRLGARPHPDKLLDAVILQLAQVFGLQADILELPMPFLHHPDMAQPLGDVPAVRVEAVLRPDRGAALEGSGMDALSDGGVVERVADRQP